MSSEMDLHMNFMNIFLLGCQWKKAGFFEQISSIMADGSQRSMIMTAIIKNQRDHRFIEIGHGYFGLAPRGTLSVDDIYVVKGCNVPLVLRKVDNYCIYVGSCFVLGLMNGEAKHLLDAGKAEIKRLEIR